VCVRARVRACVRACVRRACERGCMCVVLCICVCVRDNIHVLTPPHGNTHNQTHSKTCARTAAARASPLPPVAIPRATGFCKVGSKVSKVVKRYSKSPAARCHTTRDGILSRFFFFRHRAFSHTLTRICHNTSPLTYVLARMRYIVTECG